MQVIYLGKRGTWRDVANSANTTIDREHGTKEPSSSWKTKMLRCEHSPIRAMSFKFIIKDLKSWVSVHLVRHKFGIEHWVRTQRTDRTGINRDDLPQGNLVDHEILVNTQAMINISRKRLCRQASPETREAWEAVVESIKNTEPELYNACVPDCIYRGYCPEFRSCGYSKTKEYQERLKEYRGE